MANITRYCHVTFREEQANIKNVRLHLYTETDVLTERLNINAFYPGGYLPNLDADFISNFNFFRFENDRIVTYIDKGLMKRIYFEGKFMSNNIREMKIIFNFKLNSNPRQDYTTPVIYNTTDLNGMDNITLFCNSLFWSDMF